jgi:hypothetical protein
MTATLLLWQIIQCWDEIGAAEDGTNKAMRRVKYGGNGGTEVLQLEDVAQLVQAYEQWLVSDQAVQAAATTVKAAAAKQSRTAPMKKAAGKRTYMAASSSSASVQRGASSSGSGSGSGEAHGKEGWK